MLVNLRSIELCSVCTIFWLYDKRCCFQAWSQYLALQSCKIDVSIYICFYCYKTSYNLNVYIKTCLALKKKKVNVLLKCTVHSKRASPTEACSCLCPEPQQVLPLQSAYFCPSLRGSFCAFFTGWVLLHFCAFGRCQYNILYEVAELVAVLLLGWLFFFVFLDWAHFSWG